MPTFQRGFAVLDARGRFVDVVGDPAEAGHAAERVAGKHRAALWLSTSLPEDGLRPNSTPPERMPALAWRASGLSHIDFHAALRISRHEVAAALTEVRRGEGLPPVKATAVDNFYAAYVGQNAKTAKVVYLTTHGREETVAGCRGLSLAPARVSFEQAHPDWREQRRVVVTDDTQQRTFCLASVKECRAACLVGVGQNAIPSNATEAARPPRDGTNYRAKILRSLMLRQHPVVFMHILVRGFERWRRTARRDDVLPFGRLNVLSDLPWEFICPEFFEHFHDVQFYDYTKVPGRLPPGASPRNYHLTFSWATPKQIPWLVHELERGRNVAVPFFHPGNRQAGSHFPAGRTILPKSFLGAPVISGDAHDLRPLDALHPAAQDGPVIVGLRFKEPLVLDLARQGKSRRDAFGAFVVDVYETQDDAGETVFVGAQIPAYTRLGRTWVLDRPVEDLDTQRKTFEASVATAARARAAVAPLVQQRRTR